MNDLKNLGHGGDERRSRAAPSDQRRRIEQAARARRARLRHGGAVLHTAARFDPPRRQPRKRHQLSCFGQPKTGASDAEPKNAEQWVEFTRPGLPGVTFELGFERLFFFRGTDAGFKRYRHGGVGDALLNGLEAVFEARQVFSQYGEFGNRAQLLSSAGRSRA